MITRLNRLCSILAGKVFALTGASAATNAARPNILFIIADDASPHFGQAYGCSWVKTPHIDRLDRNGLVFDRCDSPRASAPPKGREPWACEPVAQREK